MKIQIQFGTKEVDAVGGAEGQQFVEENADNQSILSARCLTRNEEEIVIRKRLSATSACSSGDNARAALRSA